MFYRVTAKLRQDTSVELHKKLHDGTIRNQQPDGEEIVDALNRAVVTESGFTRFSIKCFCSSPLAHERLTIFDQHFEQLRTEPVKGYENYEGSSFMAHLAQLVEDWQ